jgi:DNA-binding XRE family transcriptional regulator
MPWHGQPLLDNLRVTFRLWKSRKHPASCKTCSDIWGEAGAPRTFEQYVRTYPPLAHGAKRHLTRKWDAGMGIRAVATFVGRPVSDVRAAISSGMLEATAQGKRQYISRTEATRWKARHCPTGDGARSWITLQTARKFYLFTLSELRDFVASGKLVSKVGTNGAMRGILYVSKHQCRRLREDVGFSEQEAAARIGVSLPQVRVLLKDVNWRKARQIPLATIQAAIKRLHSRQGYTIEEAAQVLGVPTQWVLDRKLDGTIRVSSVKWNRKRLYISEPMLNRLREAQQNPPKRNHFDDSWLRISDAALEAGVTGTTIIKWAKQGTLERRRSSIGWRYPREALRARARDYWQTVRFHRATPPNWMAAESSA